MKTTRRDAIKAVALGVALPGGAEAEAIPLKRDARYLIAIKPQIPISTSLQEAAKTLEKKLRSDGFSAAVVVLDHRLSLEVYDTDDV